ncbi:methyltransferase domain-containing protein [Tenacibaculum sp. M341]|uniref:methyltransferase domain-containing protein n=1 Tax=Tenacibaculum sp. M341 TaxID=2530339 RepID=UPI0026AFC5A2
MIDLSEDFWTNKYKSQKTGWDLGEISTPLKAYFDQLANKNLKILIPGAGNSYEAEYLFQQGFKNVYIVDISREPLINFKERVINFPEEQLIHKNYFDLEGRFDLIIEQTFFCAINPEKRATYVQKTLDLLKNNGKLVGLLFDAKLNSDHPPFGGNKASYLELFKPYFEIETMDKCYNSLGNRQGMELFIKLKKYLKM